MKEVYLMEFLIEAILDLILEGSIEISKNKKVSKWIRYPLLVIIILFFAIVIFGILLLGILLIKTSFIGGLLIILIGLLMLISSIIKFKKIYIEKKEVEKK